MPDVAFGYQRFDDTVGRYVQSGLESMRFRSARERMYPINVGVYDYVIFGKKGYIVNWMKKYEDQLVKVADDPAYAGKRLHFMLHETVPSLGEQVCELFTGTAFRFVAGPAEHIHTAFERGGQMLQAYDYAETFRESGSAAEGDYAPGLLGRKVDNYMFPALTKKKVLRLTTDPSPGDWESATKRVRTRVRSTTFSNVAAWMFGS